MSDDFRFHETAYPGQRFGHRASDRRVTIHLTRPDVDVAAVRKAATAMASAAPDAAAEKVLAERTDLHDAIAAAAEACRSNADRFQAADCRAFTTGKLIELAKADAGENMENRLCALAAEHAGQLHAVDALQARQVALDAALAAAEGALAEAVADAREEAGWGVAPALKRRRAELLVELAQACNGPLAELLLVCDALRIASGPDYTARAILPPPRQQPRAPAAAESNFVYRDSAQTVEHHLDAKAIAEHNAALPPRALPFGDGETAREQVVPRNENRAGQFAGLKVPRAKEYIGRHVD